jgi:hypothetical protein
MASRWVRIRLGKSPIPTVAAVYAIYCDGVLTYVGSTENLRSRMCSYGFEFARYSHSIKSVFGFHTEIDIKYSTGCRGEWLKREWRLINRLRPPANVRGTGRSRKVAANG